MNEYGSIAIVCFDRFMAPITAQGMLETAGTLMLIFLRMGN